MFFFIILIQRIHPRKYYLTLQLQIYSAQIQELISFKEPLRNAV